MDKIGIKILVNALTIFRCVFTFAMPFLIDKVPNTTFIIFIVFLYCTDWLDGLISRKFNAQTLFGSMMDTLADKILCIVLIVCIANKHGILFWIMIGEIVIGSMSLLRCYEWSNNCGNIHR